MSEAKHPPGCGCGGFDRNGSHDAGEYVDYCAEGVAAAFRAQSPEHERLYRESEARSTQAVNDELQRHASHPQCRKGNASRHAGKS